MNTESPSATALKQEEDAFEHALDLHWEKRNGDPTIAPPIDPTPAASAFLTIGETLLALGIGQPHKSELQTFYDENSDEDGQKNRTVC